MGVAIVRIRISLLAILLLWVWPWVLVWRVGMGMVPGIGHGRCAGRRKLAALMLVRSTLARAAAPSLSSSFLGRATLRRGTFAAP